MCVCVGRWLGERTQLNRKDHFPRRTKKPLEDLLYTVGGGAKPIYDEITKNELNCMNRILRQLS